MLNDFIKQRELKGQLLTNPVEMEKLKGYFYSSLNDFTVIFQKLHLEWIAETDSPEKVHNSSADRSEMDKLSMAYIAATTKPCPNCGFPGTHYHGHACHHIRYI